MKTKNLLPVIFAFAFIVEANAQTKFTRMFWYGQESIYPTCIMQSLDGGFIVAGTVKDTAIGSLPDIFMTKFSSIGDTVWTRRIAANGTEAVNDVQQTNDGGYIIAGRTNSFGAGGYDAFLLKTDSSGITSWMKTYGDSGYDNAYSVKQNSDSGYILAGCYTDSIRKGLLLRSNSLGDTLWVRKIWSTNNSETIHASQTSDGGFIVSGSYFFMQPMPFSNGTGGMILKITSTGSQVWAKGVYVPNGSLSASYISQTSDDSYILTTESAIIFTPSVSFIHKFDSIGNNIFGRRITSNYFNSLSKMNIKQLPDGTSLLVGNAYFGSQSEFKTMVIKIDLNGDTLWTKKLDSSKYDDAVITFDNGIGLVSNSSLMSAAPRIITIDSTLNSECNSFQNYLAGYLFNNEPTNNLTLNSSMGGIILSNATPLFHAYFPKRLFTPCTPNIPTCVVTVDSITQKNLVVWEENFDTTFVDSYQVYKESTAAGVYNLIGSVPLNQFSTFLDTASNPAVQAQRYRMTALWHSFYEPPPATASHKTIHLSINLGLPPSINLIWSSYEGFSYSTYNIWRGNGTSAAVIASVPFGTNSYTDLTPPPGDSIYFIEVVHTPCNPSLADDWDRQMMTQYAGTRSNMVNRNSLVGINDITGVTNLNLFPNPAGNEFTIYDLRLTIESVEVYDVLGEKCLTPTFSKGKGIASVDVSSLSPGIYFVKVKGTNEERVGKIVKQ